MKASKAEITYKNDLYEQLALIGKSLSTKGRLEIMNLLAQSPKTVAELARLTQMSVANTSRHLQVLKGAHLVKNEKRKNFIIYELASHKVAQMFYLLRDVGEEELPAMKAIKNDFAQQEGVHPLTLQQARSKARDPQTHVIDLRDVDEFQHGHLPGAINLPVSDLEKNIGQFSRDDPLILYCRGHLCGLADQAAHFLRQKGFKAYSLNETYGEWQRFSSSSKIIDKK